MSRGTALITGASSGIGAAFAKLLATEGFDLILTARRTDRLEALKTTILEDISTGISINIIGLDLANSAGPQALFESIEALGLDVDILINNAGMMGNAEFADLGEDEISQLIELNITTLTRITHYFVNKMLIRKVGRILNVASVAAFHPIPGMDIYAASKAYVLSLTEALSEQLKNTGVSITALCPGLTDTEMASEDLVASIPPFLVTKPEEVAREGFSALMNREVIRVPGNANKFALTWAQHQPRWLVRGLGGLAARFGGARRP